MSSGIPTWNIATVCAIAVGVMTTAVAQETASSSLPEIPYPQSDFIKGIHWLGREARNPTAGDTWSATWASDDNLYTVGDDNGLGYNLSVYKIEGIPPRESVASVNQMEDYGKIRASHWWKGAGLTSIDGVLYLGIYAQSDPSVVSASKVSYNAENSSIIKSTDYGKTWSSSAENSWNKPMFPDKEFPTPFFIQYGKDYSGAMDDYVYLCSNDGGWNNWNRLILARIPRAKFGNLDRKDWEFFVSADSHNIPAWTSDVKKAGAIFGYKLHTGMTGIQYIPALKGFVLAEWSYVAEKIGKDERSSEQQHPEMSSLSYPWPDDATHESEDQTMLSIFEAPKPWGPWKLAYAQAPWGPAFYGPSFPAKWFEEGGRKGWMIEGGNWRDMSSGGYHFITQKMEWLTR